MPFTYAELKERQRIEREGHSQGIAVRIHRALSWLERSELCSDDDGKFIFLWIAFNAAYSQETSEKSGSTKLSYKMFLEKLVELDRANRLYDLFWNEFSNSIRSLISNQYVFQSYWDFTNGLLTEEEWKNQFKLATRVANQALAANNTVSVAEVVLSRLYTLRNQLIHGGATWNSDVNRAQVRDGSRFLGRLVPLVILLMLENHTQPWGPPCYPVIET